MKLSPFLVFSLCFSMATTNSFSETSKAPAIHLPAIDGEMHIAQLKGKVVYLDFWASWCGPCRDSFPWMAEMKKKYGAKGLEIVAVNLDKERTAADKFLKDMEINFIVAFDSSGDTAEKYKLRGMPVSYLISRDGYIQAPHPGFHEKDKEKHEVAIKNLLQQQ